MSRGREYKVRIRNLTDAVGKEQTKISFSDDVLERIWSDRLDVRIANDKVVFTPSKYGRFSVNQTIAIRGVTETLNMRTFNGEYHAFIRSDDGGYYVKLSDKTGYKTVYTVGKKAVPEKAVEPEKPTEPTKPKYKNPYITLTAQETTLRNIISGQNERLRQLTNDIAEAEKMLAELREERDNLVAIQTKAQELITMLGGKK